MFTARDIEDRLESAASVIRRLPAVKKPRLAQQSFPIVHDRNTAFGYTDINPDAVNRSIPPDARAIADMEQALDWLMLVENPEDRTILWMRANNVRWKPIYIRFGLSRGRAWARWVAALLTVANHLNAAERAAARPKQQQIRQGLL